MWPAETSGMHRREAAALRTALGDNGHLSNTDRLNSMWSLWTLLFPMTYSKTWEYG